MAKATFQDWSTTANSNTDVGGINIAEGCPPSNINNAIREVMAQLRAGVDGEVVYSAKSANYTAVATDNNAYFRFTAAATLSLTAAATLGANWHCFVQADGGNVLIDPNSSETINGSATMLLVSGQSAYIICDGTNFFAIGPQISTVDKGAVINGNFLVNQRVVSGSVVLAAGVYGHDMWKAGSGGCTYTFSTSGGSTTITISAGTLVQKIEGRNLRTGTYTLAWAGTAQGKIGAGAFSASGVTGSITGGTDTTIEFNTGTLSQVRMQRGTQQFQFVPFEVDLQRCKRFYQKSYEYTVAPGASPVFEGTASVRRQAASETATVFSESLQTEMVSAPTVVWYSPNTGNSARLYNASAAVNVIVTGTSTAAPTSTKKLGVPLHAAEGAAGAIIVGQWTAEATW